jgi:hypothetical protein
MGATGKNHSAIYSVWHEFCGILLAGDIRQKPRVKLSAVSELRKNPFVRKLGDFTRQPYAGLQCIPL